MTRNEIEAILDPKCGSGSNLAHLEHVFEGYSAGADDTNNYPFESARWFSWKLGQKLRRKDDRREAVARSKK